jgi:hypothetical protein
MTPREVFEFEVSALEQEVGTAAKLRAYQVLAEVVRWLRKSGHGNITLSAVNNLFGEKIRTETIVSIDRSDSIDHMKI